MDRLIQEGTVGPASLLWKQGMTQWVTLEELRARNPVMFSSMPPPPLPASDDRSDVEEDDADGRTHATRRPMRLEPEEAKPAPPEVPIYAGFGVRAAAFLVDLLLWGLVWRVVSNLVVARYFPDMVELSKRIQETGWFSYQPTPEELSQMVAFQGVILLVTLAWVVLYDLIFIPRFGATPGKLLFGLRLVTARNKPLGALRILARALARVLSGVPTLFIGFLVAAVDDQKRGLHDFFCGTRVVKKR